MEQVLVLAQAVGLEVEEADLPEVTHRLNATIKGVNEIEHPDLDQAEPVPYLPLDV